MPQDGPGEDKSTVVPARVYEAIQKGISETDEVSFKLMGYIPIASGGGLLAILVGGKESALPISMVSVFALFAAALTVGLFWWELWNIQLCHWYIKLASALETTVFDNYGLSPKLTTRPDPPGKMGKHHAAKVIYTAMILGWLALPLTMNFSGLDPDWQKIYIAVAFVIVIATMLANLASTDPADAPNIKALS